MTVSIISLNKSATCNLWDMETWGHTKQVTLQLRVFLPAAEKPIFTILSWTVRSWEIKPPAPSLEFVSEGCLIKLSELDRADKLQSCSKVYKHCKDYEPSFCHYTANFLPTEKHREPEVAVL